jgi:hypothetical protein
MKKEFLNIDLSDKKKANYFSRIFGVFYEGLIEFCWESKRYKSIGRPSVYKNGKHLKTFDYTLEKKDGTKLVAEAKCWLAFEDFYYTELTTDLVKYDLLDKKDASALQFILELGKDTEYNDYTFKYSDKNTDKKIPFTPGGKALIWARVAKNEKIKIKKEFGFSEVFSIEEIIKDMVKKIKSDKIKGKEFRKYVRDRKKWANELFDSLMGEKKVTSKAPVKAGKE